MHEKFKAKGQVIDERNRDIRRLRQHLLSKGAAGSSQPVTAAEENGSAAATGWFDELLRMETVRAPGSTQTPLCSPCARARPHLSLTLTKLNW
jgi:hypothetical protein